MLFFLLYVKITIGLDFSRQQEEPRGRSEYNSLVLFVLSGILTVLLILAHSGKGTGVSDTDCCIYVPAQKRWFRHYGEEP